MKETHRDAIILGAGAAGLMCAMTAGKRGLSIALLEHNDRPGRKIRISGGGRSNFTNLDVSAENYVSDNPHFCKSALARYTQYDFLDLIHRHNIAYHERLHGQLFCDDSAQQITDMFCNECADHQVDIITRCSVGIVEKHGDLFVLDTNKGTWTAPKLVIATGGLSIPKIGATGFGYQLARQFGLSIVPTRAALVPLRWNDRDKPTFGELSGISFPAEVGCGSRTFHEQVLLTHRGLSGPAILQISLYWTPGQKIWLNLLPHIDVQSELTDLQRAGKEVSSWLNHQLPKRFAQCWAEQHLPNRPFAQINAKERSKIGESLEKWSLMPNGSEGYRTAEATAGGVDTNALSSRTMEVRDVPGLYFVGEVVDVTGWLGGYNFQWAWSSAAAAGQSL